jgi:hypothetical protein
MKILSLVQPERVTSGIAGFVRRWLGRSLLSSAEKIAASTFNYCKLALLRNSLCPTTPLAVCVAQRTGSCRTRLIDEL